MLNEEGGIDPLEFRFNAVVDRINTTGTAWLGLTVGCAQCHTHKYDPIRHTEYYGLFGLLNNRRRAGDHAAGVGGDRAEEAGRPGEGGGADEGAAGKWPAGTTAVWAAAPSDVRVTTTGRSRPEPAEGLSWRFVGENRTATRIRLRSTAKPGRRTGFGWRC
jgi:hypothetical protein